MKRIFIIIAALTLCLLSYGKSAKSQLEELVEITNKQTPLFGNGMTWTLDSVHYDRDRNLFTYYYSSLLIYDEILSKNIQRLSEKMFKHQVCSNLSGKKGDLDLFKKAKADLGYQYKKSTGEVIRTFILENELLSKEFTAEEMKENDRFIMIESAQNANAQCPINVDMYTIMTSCSYDEQNYLLTYNYNVTTDNIRITEDFENRMKNALVQLVQSSISLNSYKRNNVTFKYRYLFNGKDLKEIIIMPIDYK